MIKLSRAVVFDTNADANKLHAAGREEISIFTVKEKTMSQDDAPVFPYGSLSLSMGRPNSEAVSNRPVKY